MSRAVRFRRTARATACVLAFVVLAGCAALPAPEAPRGDVRVIAHRGASAYVPENSLPAIDRALEQGAVDVELDVRLSRDGVAVLFHDEHLAEKTGAEGRVRDHDARFLRDLEVGTWFDRTHPGARERFADTPLTTLEDAFRAFGSRPFYHLELKSTDPELVEVVALRITEHDLADRVVLTSFHGPQLARARALVPEIPRAHLLERHDLGPDSTPGEARHRAAIDRAASEDARQVAVAAAELTPALVRHAHERGLEIRAWNVETLDDWRRVLDLGADGATVDWPDRALAELAARRGGGR